MKRTDVTTMLRATPDHRGGQRAGIAAHVLEVGADPGDVALDVGGGRPALPISVGVGLHLVLAPDRNWR
jgi:hypothetical protein